MDMPSTALADLSIIVTAAFTKHYGVRPSHIARAPGRINIIGEHTDYNDGFVLPAAIDRAIYVAARVREDDKVSVQSLDYSSDVVFSLSDLENDQLPHYTKFIRGVLWIMHQRGYSLHGVNLTLSGNVPNGGGFSSSAAIEVAVTEALCGVFGLTLTQVEKAMLGVDVEHKFIGVPTGVMDEMISAMGQIGHALLIDCRSLQATAIPMPSGCAILALDTGKRRELANSEYGVRRQQCEEAAQILGVKALRDITPEELTKRLSELPPWIAKRAQHVVNENARTLAAVDALRANDLVKVGQLLNESHASLRDLYQVSIEELDIMADIAQKEVGCYGARMMGGGFGGAVIALVREDMARGFAEGVSEIYQIKVGTPPPIYFVKIGPGSSVTKLG
jgi:galactokinase